MQKASQPSSDDVVEMIREAASQGYTIMVLPGRHPELPLTTGLRLLLGLRPAESRVLAALVQQGCASRAALHAAMFYNPMSSLKSVDVMICHLRRRLRPHGIEIVTISKLGYQLTEDSRDKIRNLLADHAAGIVDAATPPAGNAGVRKTKPIAA